MLHLLLSLLLVSLVLGIDHSTDKRLNTSDNVKPDRTLTYNVQQRRIQQHPHVEIKEENVGRYFRRRPKTTTVSSIFSMKVENESQHVYPNIDPVGNLHVETKQEKINMTDIRTSTQQQSFPSTNSFNNRRPNITQKRILYSRTRRPNRPVAQTPALINQRTEKITEQLVTSTTTVPFVDSSIKEHEKNILPASAAKFLNKVSSLDRLHSNIFRIREASIQRKKEPTGKVVTSSSDVPVFVSSTDKEPEEPVLSNMTDRRTPTQQQIIPSTTSFTNQTSINIQKTIRYTRKRRPSSAQISALKIYEQTENMNERIVTSTTAVPIVDDTIKQEEKVMLPTSNSKLLNNVSSLERPSPTLSQIPEAFIPTLKETPKEVIVSETNSPVAVSITENEPVKRVFTPSAKYISNLISIVKKHRPTFAPKSVLSVIQEKEANDSTRTAPTTVAAIPQVEIQLYPTTSYVSDIVTTGRPKSRRRSNRGSHKHNWNDEEKGEFYIPADVLYPKPSQVNPITLNPPPPVPTLSPWFDGFGK